MKKKHIIFTLVLSVGVFLVWGLLPSEPVSLCELQTADKFGFDITAHNRIETSTAVAGGGGAASEAFMEQNIQSSVSLSLLVTEHGDTPTLQGVVTQQSGELDGNATPGSLWPALESSHFAMRLDGQCQISELGFHRSLSAEQKRMLQGLLQFLSFAAPPSASAGNAGSYEVAEQDNFGALLVNYSFREEGDSVRLQRKRLRYSAQEDALQRRIVASQRTLHLEREKWIRGVQGLEITELLDNQRVLLRLESSVQIVAKAAEVFAAVAGDALDWGEVERIFDMPSGTAGADESAALTPDEAWQRFRTIYLEEGGQSVAVKFFSDYLRKNPEAALEVLKWIRQGICSDSEQALMTHILSRVGTDEARFALEALANDASLAESTRVKAVAAMGDLVNPNETSVNSLREAAHRLNESQRSENDLVGNAAMMAAGLLSKRQREANPQLSEAGVAILEDAMASGDLTLQREALVAVGNTQAAGLTAKLNQFTYHPDLSMRRAAARGLRGLEANEIREVSQGWLPREKDTAVKVEIVDNHTKAARLSPDQSFRESVRFYVQLLMPFPERDLRLSLVRFLTVAAAKDELARLALVRHFPREPDGQIQQLIGTVLSAEELTGAP